MPKPLETRLKVAKVLSQLLRNRTIDQVSVVEVCGLAEISRTTFYSYFKDIYNVEEWLWDYSIENVLCRIGGDYGWREGHEKMFSLMTEHKEFFANPRTGSTPPPDDSGFDYADRRSLEIHIRHIEEKRRKPLSEDELMQMRYVSNAFACLTRKWIDEGMEIPPRRMAELFISMLPEFAVDALGE